MLSASTELTKIIPFRLVTLRAFRSQYCRFIEGNSKIYDNEQLMNTTTRLLFTVRRAWYYRLSVIMVSLNMEHVWADSEFSLSSVFV